MTSPDRRNSTIADGPQRRGVVGIALGLLCAPGAALAAAVPCRDAGLLRLCSGFHQAHDASHAADDASWEAYLDRRNEYADAIEDMPATTDAGKLAKARVALVLMEEQADTGNACERFTLAALRDLVGSAAA